MAMSSTQPVYFGYTGMIEPGGVGRRFLERTQPSLEAQLCNLADEIAYNAHDIDDGVRSGLLRMEALAEVELFERHLPRQAVAGANGDGTR